MKALLIIPFIFLFAQGYAQRDTVSPDGRYKIHQIAHQPAEAVTIDLILKDTVLKRNAHVCHLITYDWPGPKFFWTDNSKFLITENGLPEDLYKREVVFFDLKKFQVKKRVPGVLLAFDNLNGVVFLYRYNLTQQEICYFNYKTPGKLKNMSFSLEPDIVLPEIALDFKKRQATVKVFSAFRSIVSVFKY